MLRTITVTNYVGDELTIDMWNPEKSGFLITKIDGLDSPGATINTTDVPTNDGSIFNSSRLKVRDITISLKLLPNPTIENSRLILYKHFPAKRPVTLTVKTDSREAWITGYVEKLDVQIFNKNETAAITLNCPVPYFEDVNREVLQYYQLDEEFEFEYDPVYDSTLNFYTEVFGEGNTNNIASSRKIINEVALESIASLKNSETPYEQDFYGYSAVKGMFTNSGTYCMYWSCKPNTKYHFLKTLGNRCRIGTCDEVPTINSRVRILTPDDISPLSATVETPADAKYIIMYPCSIEDYHSAANVASDLLVAAESKKFCMSDITSVFIKNIPYQGDIETGCLIKLHCMAPVKNVVIYNLETRAMMAINATLESGTDIEICTIKNRKYARKIGVDGKPTSILNYVTRDSDWLQLVKGDNVFAYVAEVGAESLQLSIESAIIYEGM